MAAWPKFARPEDEKRFTVGKVWSLYHCEKHGTTSEPCACPKRGGTLTVAGIDREAGTITVKAG